MWFIQHNIWFWRGNRWSFDYNKIIATVSYDNKKLLTENTTDALSRFYSKTMRRRPKHLWKRLLPYLIGIKYLLLFFMPCPLRTAKHGGVLKWFQLKELHTTCCTFGSVLIKLILSGKAKLSMSSCSVKTWGGMWFNLIHISANCTTSVWFFLLGWYIRQSRVWIKMRHFQLTKV